MRRSGLNHTGASHTGSQATDQPERVLKERVNWLARRPLTWHNRMVTFRSLDTRGRVTARDIVRRMGSPPSPVAGSLPPHPGPECGCLPCGPVGHVRDPPGEPPTHRETRSISSVVTGRGRRPDTILPSMHEGGRTLDASIGPPVSCTAGRGATSRRVYGRRPEPGGYRPLSHRPALLGDDHNHGSTPRPFPGGEREYGLTAPAFLGGDRNHRSASRTLQGMDAARGWRCADGSHRAPRRRPVRVHQTASGVG